MTENNNDRQSGQRPLLEFEKAETPATRPDVEMKPGAGTGKKARGRRASRALYAVLIVILSGVLVFSSWKLGSTLWDYHKGEQDYKALSSYQPQVSALPAQTPPAAEYQVQDDYAQDDYVPPEEGTSQASDLTVRLPLAGMDFSELRRQYPDIVGWIVIPNTRVNYPVTYNGDNSYYLTHTASGGASASGSIFLDMANNGILEDDNTVLYGHNMKNGSMFRTLISYRSRDFLVKHPYIYLYTPEATYELRIFSVRIAADTDVRTLNFGQGFDDYLSKLQRASLFKSDYAPEKGTPILTLSTCTYDFENARFLVHAAVVGRLDVN